MIATRRIRLFNIEHNLKTPESYGSIAIERDLHMGLKAKNLAFTPHRRIIPLL